MTRQTAMSVYTKLTKQQALTFLDDYQLGEFVSLSGIKAGVTNSIYLLISSNHHLLVTIFEELTADKLPVYLNLMDYLARQHIPCPQVFTDKYGRRIQTVAGKPCIIAEYLPGTTIEQVNPNQLQQVASMLAKLHLAGKNYPQQVVNQRGATWRETAYARLATELTATELHLLDDEMTWQRQLDWSHLPRGIIHADLFRDNVLFQQQQLTGLIDFYYACTDAWLLDIAITINDWCLAADGLVDLQQQTLFLQHYQQLRPLQREEKEQLTNGLRLASLRFYLSRLLDFHFTKQDEHILIKDPGAYQKLLLQHRESANR